MLDVILALFSTETVTIIVGVAYVLSHVVQYLPVSWTEKIPDIVMTIVNLVAAKHGSAQAAQTDIKGNVVTPDA